jgi:flavin reductase (DIM6/NTAB) family NADH-FMN oxidoreductase RutF
MFPDMIIEEPEFRRVLGHWPTGVAIVTARAGDGSPRGLTANAITSVSLEPLLVLVCVGLEAETHAAIEATGGFAINVLPAAAERLARRFADDGRANKFDGVSHRSETTGAPILDAALAWLDCRLHGAHEGGDHTIFVGEVLAADAQDGEPLLFYRGGYGRVVR